MAILKLALSLVSVATFSIATPTPQPDGLGIAPGGNAGPGGAGFYDFHACARLTCPTNINVGNTNIDVVQEKPLTALDGTGTWYARVKDGENCHRVEVDTTISYDNNDNEGGSFQGSSGNQIIRIDGRALTARRIWKGPQKEVQKEEHYKISIWETQDCGERRVFGYFSTAS